MQFATDGMLPSLNEISVRNPSDVEIEGETAEKSRKFQPTNPNRTNPFAFGEGVQAHREVSVNSLSSVIVLGFANAGKPMVILSIQGNTQTVGVGDKAYGIEIIEISPPTVTMKTAQSVWTASLFESRTRSSSTLNP